MNRKVLIICSVIFLQCSKEQNLPTTNTTNEIENNLTDLKTVNYEELLTRNEKKYEINTEIPFTGVATKNESNGHLQIFTFQDGILNGISEDYYPSGQISKRTNYKSGIIDGQTLSYYDNGQLKSKIEFKNGLVEKIQGYYKDGKLYIEGDIKGGIKEFYENGTVKSEEIYNENRELLDKKNYDEQGNLKE